MPALRASVGLIFLLCLVLARFFRPQTALLVAGVRRWRAPRRTKG